MAEKERLDQLLVQREFFSSREQAKAAIMAGLVRVDGEREEKAGTRVLLDANIAVQQPLHPYVGRGGLKLERAIHVFALRLEGRVVLDVGASTGGFTDCALQHGASLVFAVDVGYGQLAWRLRNDPRVVVMERSNFRYMKAEDFTPQPNLATVDVSFISLTRILPVLKQVLEPPGEIVALVKPQFEAGRQRVGKNGVVRDAKVHVEVLLDIALFALNLGLHCLGVAPSPIKGGEGNREFLMHLSVAAIDGRQPLLEEDLQRAISAAVYHESM